MKVSTSIPLHRIYLYQEVITWWDIINSTEQQMEDQAKQEFALTRVAEWAVRNQVELAVYRDDISSAYARLIYIYSDVTSRQYADYILRGFNIEQKPADWSAETGSI
jgi:hypothetical protein